MDNNESLIICINKVIINKKIQIALPFLLNYDSLVKIPVIHFDNSSIILVIVEYNACLVIDRILNKIKIIDFESIVIIVNDKLLIIDEMISVYNTMGDFITEYDNDYGIFYVFKFKNDTFCMYNNDSVNKFAEITITEHNQLIMSENQSDYEFYLLDRYTHIIKPLYYNGFINIDCKDNYTISVKIGNFYSCFVGALTTEELFLHDKYLYISYISYFDREFYLVNDDHIFTKQYFDSDIVESIPELTSQFGTMFYFRNNYNECSILKFSD